MIFCRKICKCKLTTGVNDWPLGKNKSVVMHLLSELRFCRWKFMWLHLNSFFVRENCFKLFTSLVCPLRGACEEPLDRSGRICNGRASSVSGVVPCRGPHLDHRIHFCLPANDHSWSCCYLLLHQVNPSSKWSLLASLLPLLEIWGYIYFLCLCLKE